MSHSDDDRDEDRSPEAAFALLGNETRLSILQSYIGSLDEALTFSELRERVGSPDSGQFNYHLTKLTDHFLRHTDAGYELTIAGEQIVGAIIAGTYTSEPSFDPIELDDPCPKCGGTLVADYEDEYVQLHCVECEEWRNQFTFPPGTIEQFEREELPAAFDRWLWTVFARVTKGFCQNCSGRLNAELVEDEEHFNGVYASYTCKRCGEVVRSSAVLPLFFDPFAIGFCLDQGFDPIATPTWKINKYVQESITIAESDPLEAEVVLTADEERLVATIGDEVSVTSIDREPI